VDGGYGPWGSWGQCSKTCGRSKGVKRRDRLCNNPAPKNGGKDCSNLGKDSETKSCTPPKKTCPGTLLSQSSSKNTRKVLSVFSKKITNK